MKKIIFKKIASDCVKFFLLTIFTISVIIWVLQAVNYLDFVVEDGHGFLVYFKFTLLNFPKILIRIFPFALFLSITYILLKYENKNELVIFWNFGIKKMKFINYFIKFSFGFIILNLLLNSFIVPFSQDKARSYIRTSDLDFFESILKPKKFIDIVTNLTIYFDDKNDEGMLENIFLKDNSKGENFQVTFAKTGILEIREDRRVLVLYDGKTLNNQNGKLSEFTFLKTDFNISNFSSKSTATRKTQEQTTIELIQCLLVLKKNKDKNNILDIKYKFDNCSVINLEKIYEEIYRRLVMPFYGTLLIMIALLLILKSKDDHTFRSHKLKIYTFGFLFIIFMETSSKLISIYFFQNLIISLMPFFLFSLMYIYFLNNLKIHK
tara:strand:+ start:596 stop:1732 length:1137 start_codon:yes stop_codon:yes gene_type:complete